MDLPYDEIWLVDFEFRAPNGGRPLPICVVARELYSGRLVRLFGEQLRQRSIPPYSITPDALFVAYYASAELGCHLALKWAMPANILDLFAEFRALTNGTKTPAGSGLLGVLTYFSLDGFGTDEKESMRQLAMRGEPYNGVESVALLDYCQADVDALARLLPAMLPKLDLARALIRGRYMAAAACIEWNGIPVDVAQLERLQGRWGAIQARLIEEVDRDYGVYEGTQFKRDRWEHWLTYHSIPWPRLPSGQLAMDDDTFREMARSYPCVAPIRELRVSLSQLRLSGLTVGADGRNRCLLSAFRSRTGRNQPSNTKFLFGPAVWIRGLIRPNPGCGIAYIDWSQQEFGIAAALSNDEAMLAAYQSGDPYLSFGKQAGAIPTDGTKASHATLRDQFKACVLAVQYGMGPTSLSDRIDQPPAKARQLLQLHKQAYPTFWRWSEAAVDQAFLAGSLQTVFGWPIRTGPEANGRSLSNFPMQANGAEMLRLACIAATEQGVRVCAPVHDALLIEAPLDQLDTAIWTTQQAMRDASTVILGGFELRSDAYVIRHPDRYMDERGEVMWDRIMRILDESEPADTRRMAASE